MKLFMRSDTKIGEQILKILVLKCFKNRLLINTKTWLKRLNQETEREWKNIMYSILNKLETYIRRKLQKDKRSRT